VRQFQEYKRHSQEEQTGLGKTQVETTGQTGLQPGDHAEQSAPHEAPAPGESAAPEEAVPPPLRHRGETGPAPDAAPPETRHRPELLTRRVVAEGTITDTTCPDSVTLELTLKSAAGTRKLYHDTYYKIPFSALNYTPQGILNPCTDIKGMRAHITYRPAKDHPEQGEIVSVQLVK
jgi:hypothetical protein